MRVSATTAWRPTPIEPTTHIISGSPIAVFSDIHAPLHSQKWVELGINTALEYGCKRLIVNGDFIDANQISRHNGSYYRRKAELNDDLEAGAALTKLFADEFEHVDFLMGNHCGERLVKHFGGEVAVQRLWKLFGDHANVKVTSRSFVRVNDKVLVGHPRSYSRIRGNIAQKIAMRHQMHVLLGHLHHSAMSVTPDGKWQACELGCMAQLDEFDYTQNEINDMPEPMNGFAIVSGDRIRCFDRFSI